jgi:hypothetical protein
LYVGRDASGPASQPGVRLDPHPLLEQYLREHEIPETDLQEIVGEINLVGGGARSEELVQRTLDVIVLAEEPPGNELPDSSLQLPEETFDVVCQGSCWPGYDRASLAPDGDVVADHVVMGSVFPPPA